MIMSQEQGAVSEVDLDEMIHALPRIVRSEIVKAIRMVEVEARETGVQDGWPALLKWYRATHCPIWNPNAVSTFSPPLVDSVRALHLALQKAHTFTPEDYLCKPVVSAVATINRTGKVNSLRRLAKQDLIAQNYLGLPRGKQGKLKEAIGEKRSQSLRQMDLLISELKADIAKDGDAPKATPAVQVSKSGKSNLPHWP